jgi:hypothetical protein
MALVLNGSGITSANIADGTITTDDILASDVKNLKSGRKNLIINGGFDVWQRGTSGFSSNDTYTADRWKLNLSGGTGSIAQSAFTVGQADVPNNPKYYLDLDITAGNDNTGINHRIEDVASCAGQTVTVSFYAKGANPGGGVTYVHLGQNFGSGGSATVDTTAQSFTLTGTWQRFTFQFDVPSITGKTIGSSSFLWLLIGQKTDTSTSAWNMDIANVQLELGSVATDFEHRSYGEELALCQRYYQKVSGTFSMIGSRWSTVHFCSYHMPVTMRELPTFLVSTANAFQVFGSNTSAHNSTESSVSVAGKDSCELQVTNTNTASSAFIRFTASSDWFSLDAEL